VPGRCRWPALEPPAPEILGDQRAQRQQRPAQPVPARRAVDPRISHAGHLHDPQVLGGRPDVDQGDDLVAVAPDGAAAPHTGQVRAGQVEGGQAVPPVRVVARRQIGEPGAEQGVDQPAEHGVAEPVQAAGGQVHAALAVPRPVRHLGPGQQRPDVPGQLARVGGAVRVQGDHDVAGAGGEPADQRVALAGPGRPHQHGVRAHLAGHRDRVVGGAAVHDDNLVDPGQPVEHVRQVFPIVENREDDADRG
jgi:hypothetical protein